MSVTFKKPFNTFLIYLLAILLSACGIELVGTTQVGEVWLLKMFKLRGMTS